MYHYSKGTLPCTQIHIMLCHQKNTKLLSYLILDGQLLGFSSQCPLVENAKHVVLLLSENLMNVVTIEIYEV